MKLALNILLILIFAKPGYSQEPVELKHADQLTGKTVDGKQVREVSGNVQFVQGNVTVFCNSAVQYVDENRVDLIGNVRILQDTLTLTTAKGTYRGNDRTATGEGGITLKDPNATLRANNGIYYFNDTKAVFNGNVIIVNPTYTITSSNLTYLRNTEDSYARGNVVVTTDSAIIKAESIDFLKRIGKTVAFQNASIVSDSTTITADTLTNLSNEDQSFASGNVKIVNLKNNVTIYGDYLENYERTNYTKVNRNVRLMQIENDKDTLFIYSRYMEAFRTPPEHYDATDSVEIIRGEFLSKSGKAVYYDSTESVSLADKPIVWQTNSQMTGDSIYADLPGKKLQTIYAKKLSELAGTQFSFLISRSDKPAFTDRYDQVSGTDITMHFAEDKINLVEVTQNANSVYFIYEENKANGVNKAEGENMYIYFDSAQQVEKIRIDRNPAGQYIPETRMSEASLTLPGFIFRSDKPVRRQME